MIRGIEHVGLSVSSMDRAVEFYRNAFGMELVSRSRFCEGSYEYAKKMAILGLKDASGESALLRLGDMQIELFEFASPQPKLAEPNRPVCDHGISHFCLQVADMQEEYARLKAAGVVFHCEPQHFPGQALVTYGRDPDGNVFELLEWIKAPVR